MERPIEYWRELYLLHAQTKGFTKKVERSKDYIKEFLEVGVKSYLSYSGGKDSSTMVHLVSTLCDCSKMSIVSQKDDMDFPNEKEFVRDFAERCKLDIEIIEPKESLWEVAKNVDFTEDIHSKGTAFSDDNFYGLLRAHQKQENYKGAFLGLRAEESKGRRINAAVNRHIYYNLEWRQLICQPLMNWSAKDVFAYLFLNDLPIMDVYFKTKFTDSPEQIRKSWVLPSAQSSRGQAVWLKYYYPHIFAKLAQINPKIRCYV